MLFIEACHRNVDLEHPMYYNETNDGRDDSSGSDNFLIDSVLGVVRMEAEGCGCLQEFPIVPFLRWWNCVSGASEKEAD